ncbi:CapA family protein [Pyxidicoccus trucidator]|uniref:CapA family protein n=1 Tax=Pyxidicoccus trucidator TaxID=2709662 RepID=UPI0013DC0BF2|nr:CapA family protein [Pyxidicoccus trucidator]
MPSSVFLMLALATTPGAPSAREPASAHNFSTAQARTAELLSTAGTASVKAALQDARAGVLAGAALGATAPDSASGTVIPSQATTATAPDSTSGTTVPPSSAAPVLSDVGRVAAEAAAGALRAAGLALRNGPAPTPATVADADASYSRGLEALKAKDTRTAITELSACVEAAPSRVDCRWELGWAYQVEGRWTDALAQWTEVQKLAPDHPDLDSALTQAQGQAALQEKLSRAPQARNRPPPPPGAKVRIRAVGDVMLGTTVPEGHLPPDGAASVIVGVRPLLEDADLTFINLEGPLCDGGKTTKCRSKGNCYAFRSPTSYGEVLKQAGVDVASTANNHSGDFGELCRRETEATLDALGIPWSGPPGSVATVERNGLRIGMVAFHTSPSCNHLNNLTTATALVSAAAAEHDLVVVSFHGGAEGSKALHVPEGREMFFGEDRGDLRTFARAVVDAGAHLVLGHGPHVARGMEFYKDRLIAYSMGNFATYGRFTLTGAQGLGMVLEVELDGQGRFSSGRILPTKQVDKGIAVPDPSGAVIKLVRGLTADDFPETGARISEDGTVKPAAKGPVSSR